MKEKIKQLTVKAMKEKNVLMRDLFRLVQSEIAKREKELKRDLTDEEVIAVLNKEKKQLNETLGFYEKGENIANKDVTIKEIAEKIAMIESLLPEQLSEDVLRARIDEIFENATFANMGAAMREVLSTDLASKADKGMISKIVKEKFSK